MKSSSNINTCLYIDHEKNNMVLQMWLSYGKAIIKTNQNILKILCLQRNPSTFVAPVKFSTGTTVQVAITLQELARKSITAVIFIEYFTLANILQG